MRKRKFVVGKETQNLLQTALMKKMPLTITRKHGEDWEMYKSHIISILGHRMVIAMPEGRADQPVMAYDKGQELAISFKKGYNKCLFTSRIISQGRTELEPGKFIETLMVYIPEQIEKIQRRIYERTMVPSGEQISVSFWPINDSKSRYVGELTDLSGGGIGVVVNNSVNPEIEPEQHCTVQFVPLPGHEPIIATSIYRHITEPESDGRKIGFQFIGLETTEQGRMILRRIGRVVTIYERRNSISNNYSCQHY